MSGLVGVVLYAMLMGKFPFQNPQEEQSNIKSLVQVSCFCHSLSRRLTVDTPFPVSSARKEQAMMETGNLHAEHCSCGFTTSLGHYSFRTLHANS